MDMQSKVIVAGALGLVVGYFAGREHVKYQIASALGAAAQNFSSAMSKGLPTINETLASPPAAAIAPKAAVGVENAKTYGDKLSLYDFTSAFHQTYEGRVPGVEFKIKNLGDKTVSSVKVTVYFQDASGATIAEQNYYPVNTSSFSSGNSGPLKPGYVWQQERNKFYQAKQVPTEWKEGAAKAAITEIEFE